MALSYKVSEAYPNSDWDDVFGSHPHQRKGMSKEIYGRDEKLILSTAKKYGYEQIKNNRGEVIDKLKFERIDGKTLPFCGCGQCNPHRLEMNGVNV